MRKTLVALIQGRQACADGQRKAGNVETRDALALDRLPHVFGDDSCSLHIALRHADVELVTPTASHDVGSAKRREQLPADFLHDLITHGMAERIVDRLESVDVEHRARERRAPSTGMLERLRHAVEERATGQAAGQQRRASPDARARDS